MPFDLLPNGVAAREVIRYRGHAGHIEALAFAPAGNLVASAGHDGQVKLFNGGNAALQTSFFAFGRGYNGAVHVGTADIDGDGKPDILVGSSAPVGPHLEAFAGTSLAPLQSFWALPPSFVGINVS